MRTSFVGGGNMASAIIGGLLRKGYDASNLFAIEKSPQAQAALRSNFNIEVFSAWDANTPPCEIIVLAVKPQQLKGVTQTLAPYLTNQLIISIAAGIRSTDLSTWLGGYDLIVRAMPNLPALVGAGVTGLYAMPSVSSPQQALAAEILEAVGRTLWLQDEAQLDAVTAVSGSGPAYVLYFMEAVHAAAEELGLTADQAILLTVETFLGATILAKASVESFATLRGQVTSKGGTTEKALLEMERHTVKQNIINAIHAAAQRSRELGDELGNT